MIGHRELQPGGKGHAAFHGQVRVHIQKQQAVVLQTDAVGGPQLQPVIRDAQVGDAAGQLAGVQPQGPGIGGQGEHGRHLVGQLVVGVFGRGQAFPRGKAGAGVIEQLRQGQGSGFGLAAVLCQRSLVGQDLLLQFQAPLGQPGHPLVGKLELLLQVGGTAAGRRKGLGNIVVHGRILLMILWHGSSRECVQCRAV